MTRRFASLILWSFLLGSPLVAQVAVKALTVDGRTRLGRFGGLDAQGTGVVLGAGSRETIPLEELVSLSFPNRPLGPKASSVRLELLSGEVMVGILERGDSLDSLRVAVAGAGVLQLQLDEIRRLVIPANLRPGLSLPPLTPGGDALYVAAGNRLDRIPGEVVRVEAGQVVWAGSDGDETRYNFVKDSVVALDLEPLDPPAQPEGLIAVVQLRRGSILHGALASVGNSHLGIRRGNTPIPLDPTQLMRVDIRGGSFAFLSDIDPSAVIEIPFLEGGYPAGLCRNRGFGQESHLVVGEERFDRGLGLTARTKAQWALDGQFLRFFAWVGVDAQAARESLNGSARLLIRVDGKTVFQSGLMKAGEAPRRVDVDLAGAKLLEVEVLRGKSWTVGARVALGNALLLGKR